MEVNVFLFMLLLLLLLLVIRTACLNHINLFYCTHSWHSSNLESHDCKYNIGFFFAKIPTASNVFYESSSKHLKIAISHIIYCCSSTRDNSKSKSKNKNEKENHSINIISDEMKRYSISKDLQKSSRAQ